MVTQIKRRTIFVYSLNYVIVKTSFLRIVTKTLKNLKGRCFYSEIHIKVSVVVFFTLFALLYIDILEIGCCLCWCCAREFKNHIIFIFIRDYLFDIASIVTAKTS